MSLARADIADLHDALSAVRAGHTTAQAAMADSLQAAQSPPCRAAFVRRFDAMAMAAARAADSALASGAPLPPLGGLAVSVKDLFDVAGWPTTAASRSL
ncbi:MAG TPA: amidase family protein, partial [Rubrivivax sp.]|nr:amidase family protein [Rubrivivax sp.]